MWPVWVNRDRRRQNRPGKASYGLLRRQGPHLARLRHSLLRGGMDCSKIRVGWGQSEPTVPDLCDLLMNERVRGQKQVPSWTPVRWGIDPGAPPTPRRPVSLLAESADFALAAAPLAAAARQASQDVASAPQRPWGSLPVLSAPIEGLRGLGQGQPLAGGHCLIQLTLRVSVHLWEGIFCKR